jgi:hypothetical protein
MEMLFLQSETEISPRGNLRNTQLQLLQWEIDGDVIPLVRERNKP